MIKSLTSLTLLCLLVLFQSCASGPGGSYGRPVGVSASRIETQSKDALQRLYSVNTMARDLGQRARGVLVFPEIVKGGFVAGGAFGRGALFENGSVSGYYETAAASYGLQAGIQKYGYAVMLMDDLALAALNRSGGWNIGSAPSLVIVDEGISRTLSTQTIDGGTFAFFFDQRGLMGGLGLEGSKITRIIPQYR